MKAIVSRINQLQAQLDDPEVLNKEKVELKLEAYKECLELVKNEGIRESEEEFCDNDITIPLQVKKTLKIKGKIIDEDQNSRERT